MLVAESLRRLPDPLEPVLGQGPVVLGTEVVAAIARVLLPARAADIPLPWLREDQHTAFQRTLAVLRQYGGALLAEPVGTGKSFIALAVAAVHSPGRVVVLAPAALVEQWQATANRLEVELVVHSHEAVSRGRLPARSSGLVIIDESHRFRHPATRRYRAVAPWLVGRPCLLVSATPVVNHARDLGRQLRLVLRDDALAAAGLPSLRGLESGTKGLEALGEVVVSGFVASGARPALRQATIRIRQDRCLGDALRELDRLALSTDPGVAALVRTSLWGAAASSPAALAAALLRYLALLDHAEDAARVGQVMSRDALRRFVAADPAQLILWELLPAGETTGDLILGDREAVGRLRSVAARTAERADAKVKILRAQLADRRRTLVFTSSVATVAYLWRQLGPGPVAWCTGARAGVGATILPREAVLAWFAPGSCVREPAGLATPRILVTTDVAAEGLDLQAAERVIHYDLPWTAVRADQRTGRVHRLGSSHPQVDECWLLPPRAVARRLGAERTIARKRGLPGALGVGERSAARWRRRQEAALALADGIGREGVGLVPAMPGTGGDDAVACVQIETSGGRGAVRLFVHHGSRGWEVHEERALRLLAHAATAAPAGAPDPDRVRHLMEALAPPVRTALREAAGRQWEPTTLTPAAARLLRRLRHWARIAARARDARLLERLDHAVRRLGQGMTAGEELGLAHLALREDAGLHEHLMALPAAGPSHLIPVVRLVGVVVVGRET